MPPGSSLQFRVLSWESSGGILAAQRQTALLPLQDFAQGPSLPIVSVTWPNWLLPSLAALAAVE